MNFIDKDTIEFDNEIYKHSHIVERYYVSKEGKILSIRKNGSHNIILGTKMYNAKKQPLQIGVCTYRDMLGSKVYNMGKLVLDAWNVPQTTDANGKLRTEVDHINRNAFDNRLENLRWATRAENCRNRKYFGDAIKEFASGSKWINDGVHDKRIRANEALPEGFVYGRLHHK